MSKFVCRINHVVSQSIPDKSKRYAVIVQRRRRVMMIKSSDLPTWFSKMVGYRYFGEPMQQLR